MTEPTPLRSRHPASLLAAVALAISGLVVSGCSDETDPAEATLRVGPAGGTLRITDGDLAGYELMIPPGALDREVEVSMLPVGVVPVPGLIQGNFAVEIRPDNLDLLRPATLVMPFAGEFPLTATVLGWPGSGAVVEVGPVEFDNFDTALVSIPVFQNYWVSNRAGNGTNVQSFLPVPFFGSNLWTFTDDLTVTIEMSSTEPNFAPDSVLVLRFETAEMSFGFYLNQVFFGPPGGVYSLGEFAIVDGVDQQTLHADTRLFLNAITFGQPLTEQLTSELYVPFGSMTDPVEIRQDNRWVARRPEQMFTTPLGGFDNLMIVDLGVTYTDETGVVTPIDLEILFQENFGPVRVRGLGLDAVVTGGEVSGVPVMAPIPPEDPPMGG